MIYHYDLAALIVLENVYISVYIYIFFIYRFTCNIPLFITLVTSW